MDENDYEVIFETKIRYIRPKSKDIDRMELALASLSVDPDGIRIYRYMEEKKMVTPEELESSLGLGMDTILEKLDYMYSLGLIDKLGKAYIINMSLSKAIRKRTARRITDILEYIAGLLEGGK